MRIRMEEDILVLTDENGEEQEFEVLDVIDYEEEEYVVLFPVGAGEEEPVHILRVAAEDMDDGENQYEGIGDERLIETLYQMFCKRNGL